MDIVEQVYLSLTGELVDPIRYVPNAFEQGATVRSVIRKCWTHTKGCVKDWA